MKLNRSSEKEARSCRYNFNEANYITERLWAKSHDGTNIAISLIRHNETKLNDQTPLLLYGYGSYGITLDLIFQPSDLVYWIEVCLCHCTY